MQTDVELPSKVPAKRRQLESADTLDKWIAMWLASDTITPSERRRLEDEKARRKALRPSLRVGVVCGQEGITPQQFGYLSGLLEDPAITGLCWTGGTIRHIRRAVPERLGLPIPDTDVHAVIRESDVVIVLPKDHREPVQKTTIPWVAVRYARHRRVPVKIILPNGKEANGVGN